MKHLIIETKTGKETLHLQSKVQLPVVKGARYRVLEKKGEQEVLADEVIATREGQNLKLQYADGSELTLEGYHAEGAGAQISLPGEGSDHTVASGSSGATLPASAGESAQLHYAHGHGDSLMQMVQQQPGLSEALSHHAAAGQHEIMAWVPVGQGLSAAQIGGLALVGAGAYALTRDTTPPVFTSATIASFDENGTGTAYDATADGDNGVTYTLGGTDAARFNINASTGIVSFRNAPDYETPTDVGGNNVYDITVTATDAAGNATTQAVAVSVTDVQEDTTPPVFTSATTASFDENGTGTAHDATADGDNGVTYTLGGTDAARFNINASTGIVSFLNAPDYETPGDSNSDNTYDITVTATDAAGNATDQSVAISVTDVSEVPPAAGDAVINLGTYGKLIAPVQVEGNWYYFWDRTGDGQTLRADTAVHDLLDTLFTEDINGNANPGSDTTDTYRYATLNGVRVALPTANGGGPLSGVYMNGTAVADGATTNATYDGLLAIWDANNGSGTGVRDAGTPSGWLGQSYWSATPSATGHYQFHLGMGFYSDAVDTRDTYVALQVL